MKNYICLYYTKLLTDLVVHDLLKPVPTDATLALVKLTHKQTHTPLSMVVSLSVSNIHTHTHKKTDEIKPTHHRRGGAIDVGFRSTSVSK